MTSILFVIVLMLPGLAACSSGMSRRDTATTTSGYKAPYPEVGSGKTTTIAVPVQPAQ